VGIAEEPDDPGVSLVDERHGQVAGGEHFRTALGELPGGFDRLGAPVAHGPTQVAERGGPGVEPSPRWSLEHAQERPVDFLQGGQQVRRLARLVAL
jgi:hypothetical protein